ncbi:(2Fe-2S)-binding protein [Actinosynnema mirum]|uniref:Ferric iron reductase n=1 Tax=Actinosynnema mirum (strain ATCC 29888 / DSM 43827 / JCM 3225 / NBRC 14064 / NCIMB 13271 / NRRL B-12336 / IMRU 3971 / 101) TaxID=446462 RepID=C6WIB2_ACTMD|nr:(2Fe-2S)-binding protein [Actinosynnema mirum]ACU36155.1 ferric iron reductase [Actinosynnema mirum DSM 43827]
MPDYAPVLSALREIRVISPFFALDVGRPDHTWHPGAALLDGTGLPAALDAIAARYRTAERRVAGSLFFLAHTARLLSPVTAASALGLPVPDVRPENLWWRYDPDGLRVRLAEPVAATGDLTAALAPVVAAVRAASGVAEGLLWGNAASNVAGALRTLARTPPPRRPVDAETCVAKGRELLAAGKLADTGDFIDFPGEVAFRRRSCCLYYRVAGGGTCGDCPLPPR